MATGRVNFSSLEPKKERRFFYKEIIFFTIREVKSPKDSYLMLEVWWLDRQ